MDEGEDDEDIEEEDEEDEEDAEGQFLVDLEPGGNASGGRCGLHQKQSHQDEMSNAATALQVLCSTVFSDLLHVGFKSGKHSLCFN